ncbi:F-box domain-containing protein [Favolaschia claudopus]|uniref:F-box domain-containing protein n=1 Tax=Favolaschia claudopus TaxID=2862362 RepID=A0AAW0CBI4_9AGAR
MLVTLAADRKRLAEIHRKISESDAVDAYQYPVLTLPNEIIFEIFTNVLPPYPECAPYLGLQSPLNLTHICRKWRQIALATPQLWRALLLGPANVRHDLQDVWLHRSGCCPLSIVVADEYTPDQTVYRGGEFLEAILPHRSRLEYLRLASVGLFSPPIQGSWPSLRHLDLDLDYRVHFDFSDAPLLRSVCLELVTAASVELPWTQLTSLRMHTIRFDQCIPILQRTTNIVRCELDLQVDSEVDNIMVVSGASVALPHLKSLRLSVGSDDVSTTDCLSFLDLPALSNLEFDEELLSPDPIGSLRSLISRSCCKLDRVRVGGIRSVVDESYQAVFPSIIFTFISPAAA